ncbi:MAG: prepilin-type N-terminal cleavage/methylation domain-containing protein [Acidobacteria bacterium]|jgi:type IV pilus assembly protein PilA|nr:prepilin-type N-terminal cleavage/methylation domain-containing protein [Acidobacteriota bacterium]
MTTAEDDGFTLIELLIVVAIIAVIAAIAVPGLLRARMTGNEATAVTTLKVVNGAQVAYSVTCGGTAYAMTYPTLGTPPPGGTIAFVSADIGGTAVPQKNGYTFTLAAGAGATSGPSDCNGSPTQTRYYATAVPQMFGTTGGRSYATNSANTVWQISAAAAPTEPFGAPATPVQ